MLKKRDVYLNITCDNYRIKGKVSKKAVRTSICDYIRPFFHRPMLSLENVKSKERKLKKDG